MRVSAKSLASEPARSHAGRCGAIRSKRSPRVWPELRCYFKSSVTGYVRLAIRRLHKIVARGGLVLRRLDNCKWLSPCFSFTYVRLIPQGLRLFFDRDVGGGQFV